jgi:hypothetical protein
MNILKQYKYENRIEELKYRKEFENKFYEIETKEIENEESKL